MGEGGGRGLLFYVFYEFLNRDAKEFEIFL
jgi:hypothetical protein